jgi:phage gpG-like protein
MVTMKVTVEKRNSDPAAMAKALDKVMLLMLEGNEQTFRSEGPGWKPLSQSTIDKRRKGNSPFGIKILQDSGFLKGSMTAVSHPKGHRWTNKKDRVEVGTSVKYGKYHQEGTKKMVARPFATFPSETRSKIRKVIAEGFLKSL